MLSTNLHILFVPIYELYNRISKMFDFIIDIKTSLLELLLRITIKLKVFISSI